MKDPRRIAGGRDDPPRGNHPPESPAQDPTTDERGTGGARRAAPAENFSAGAGFLKGSKRCKKCGIQVEARLAQVAFRVSQGKTQADGSRRLTRQASICTGCEQTSKDAVKDKNRLFQKAKDTIRRHGKRFAKTVLEMGVEFGWRLQLVEHALRHAWSNGCPYCHRKFVDLPGGMGSMQVDIIDPTKPPDFETNTKIVCHTCNKEKSRTPPELWAARLRFWEKWEAWNGSREQEEWRSGRLVQRWFFPEYRTEKGLS